MQRTQDISVWLGVGFRPSIRLNRIADELKVVREIHAAPELTRHLCVPQFIKATMTLGIVVNVR